MNETTEGWTREARARRAWGSFFGSVAVVPFDLLSAMERGPPEPGSCTGRRNASILRHRSLRAAREEEEGEDRRRGERRDPGGHQQRPPGLVLLEQGQPGARDRLAELL